MTPAEPSPLDDALARLGAMAQAGASPERIEQAVGDIVAGWALEADMDPATALARIERLWDSASKDASELEERINDAGAADAKALAGAKRMLAAFHATTAALAAAHEQLS